MAKDLGDNHWNADECEEDDDDDDEVEDEDEEDYDSEASCRNSRRSTEYTAEITKILQAHSDVSCSNALALNKEMLQRLLEMRERLQLLLRRVNERYNQNEQRLARNLKRVRMGVGMRGAYLRGGTFYFKGNMFFKDQNCRNCPNNPDYEHRSKIEGEMFPMDFELRSRHVWSLPDKAGIVEGIKEQVIDYLADRKLHNHSKARDRPINKQILVHTEKLVNLLAQTDEDFCVDWAQVSAHNVHYRHTPVSCEAMWKLYLHPTLKRSAWTLEENQRLLEAVKENNSQHWGTIAAAVDKRSDYQCFVQYQTSVCYMNSERWSKWNKEDDEQLLDVIGRNNINGVINWSVVATHFPHTSKGTLQSRFAQRLNPLLSHAPFTPEEDLLLLAAVEQYDAKFYCFPRTLFPNRSLAQLRSRYHNTLQHRTKLDPWSVEDDKKLMEFTTQHGSSAWLKCSQFLGNHSRTSCRTRFLTINNFFEKNPNALLEDLPRRKVRFMDNTITPENWVEKVSELRENPNADFKPEKRKKRQSSRQNAKKPTPKKGRLSPKIKRAPRKQLTAEGAALLKQCSAQGVVQLGQRAKAKSRMKVCYTERLRPNELKLYHFFKYAYNFQLGAEPCTLLPNTYSLSVVADALGFQVPTDKTYVQDSSFPASVRRKCKAILQHAKKAQAIPRDHQLPPSWPTAMGFRALCIQSAQMHTPPAQQLAPKMYVAIQETAAVQRFRARLRALFFQTTLLSRLHTRLVNNAKFLTEELPPFEASSDLETQYGNQTSTDEEPSSNVKFEHEGVSIVQFMPTSAPNDEHSLAVAQLNEITNAQGEFKRSRKRVLKTVEDYVPKRSRTDQHAGAEDLLSQRIKNEL